MCVELPRLQKYRFPLCLFIIRIQSKVLIHRKLRFIVLPKVFIRYQFVEHQRLRRRIALYFQPRLERCKRRFIIAAFNLQSPS